MDKIIAVSLYETNKLCLFSYNEYYTSIWSIVKEHVIRANIPVEYSLNAGSFEIVSSIFSKEEFSYYATCYEIALTCVYSVHPTKWDVIVAK